jgi:MotA/TolQ/ExbB proton channel family
MPDLIDLHIQGGLPFTIVLAFLLMLNGLLFIITLILTIIKKKVNPLLLQWIKHIGGFAAAFGTFSTILGLFFAFSAIEAEAVIVPFQVISGGMKVALLTILYGLWIFSLSMLAYILFRFIDHRISLTSR